MNLHDLLQNTLSDTLDTSLVAFRAELTLCATIIVLLLVKMFDSKGRTNPFYVVVLGTAAALYFTIAPNGLAQPTEIFTGLLVYDSFSVYMRALLLFFTLLLASFTQISEMPRIQDATEFFVLVLGAVLGMCLMTSANHMLTVFLGIEMASVPSYVLVGILRDQRKGSEAALKFAVFGAGAAGVMLYGISLLVGTLGSAHLPTMSLQLADILQAGPEGGRYVVLALGGLMVMVGMAFKLSAVPFHFWAPDVFEGASAEVGAFLSIASKAAALALLIRLTIGFGYINPTETTLDQAAEAAVAVASSSGEATPVAVILQPGQSTNAEKLSALKPARVYLAGLIGLLAAVTCTFGNLAAYGQTNMKRLLSYSTIAHAGYMLMPVAAAVALINSGDIEGARQAYASVTYYISIYLFMNLGAFAFVAFLRNAQGSEEIADYAGLVRRSPGITICMTITLISLIGLPPLAGFVAKFAIFASAWDGWMRPLVVIGGLNTVLSLFYYLRVVKVMILDPENEDRRGATIGLFSNPGLYCLVLAALLVVFGIWVDPLMVWAQMAAGTLLG